MEMPHNGTSCRAIVQEIGSPFDTLIEPFSVFEGPA